MCVGSIFYSFKIMMILGLNYRQKWLTDNQPVSAEATGGMSKRSEMIFEEGKLQLGLVCLLLWDEDQFSAMTASQHHSTDITGSRKFNFHHHPLGLSIDNCSRTPCPPCLTTSSTRPKRRNEADWTRINRKKNLTPFSLVSRFCEEPLSSFWETSSA